MACRTLVAQPGIELTPLQWKCTILTTAPPAKSTPWDLEPTYIGGGGGLVIKLCPTLTTSWTLPSMEFSRQEYWSGLPFPSPGDLPDPGIEPWSPALQADSLPTELQGSPTYTGKDPFPPLPTSISYQICCQFSLPHLNQTSQHLFQLITFSFLHLVSECLPFPSFLFLYQKKKKYPFFQIKPHSRVVRGLGCGCIFLEVHLSTFYYPHSKY